MIMELFKIFGTVGVKIDEASQALDQITSKAGETASTLGSKFETAGSKVTAMGKAFAPVSLAAGAAGGLLLKGAKDTAAYTDNIDKMSQKLGISRKAYQEWDYILSQNGASIDSMKMGMKSLTSSLDTVSQSGSTAGTAFERLGILVKKCLFIRCFCQCQPHRACGHERRIQLSWCASCFLHILNLRRKMKKVIHFMSVKEFTDWYQSWFRNHYKIMSKQQRNNLDELFNELVERKISDETDI